MLLQNLDKVADESDDSENDDNYCGGDK